MTGTTNDARTVTPTLAERGTQGGMFGPLARIESLRLARHPVFLFGTALGIVFTAMAMSEQADQVTGDALGLPVVALTVGLGAMLAAFHITRSFRKADELVETSPTAHTTETAALCITALVPALVASGWLVVFYVFRPTAVDAPEWMYGTLSHGEVATVLVGNSVVAAIGGTVLGVAAGRWWRFRGASAVLVVVVVVWTIGVLGLFSSGDAAPAPWTRWVRLFAPVGYFTSATQYNDSVYTLTGAPWWYFIWLLTLCALAVLAALLWRSEGETRRRLIRISALVLALSAVTYVVAAGGGLSEPVRTFPDGHSVVLTK